MDLKPGARLRSQVCTTEVIVVKPPASELTLTCGGSELVAMGTEVPADKTPAAGMDAGNQLGKRYTAESDEALEVLVTKAGAGTLADGDTPLVLKVARALPSSD